MITNKVLFVSHRIFYLLPAIINDLILLYSKGADLDNNKEYVSNFRILLLDT